MLSLIVLTFLSMCAGTSINYVTEDIPSKSKIELSPVQITCNRNDIVVLATPVVNCQDVLYHLHKPNGEVIKINFSGPKSKLLRFYQTFNLEGKPLLKKSIDNKSFEDEIKNKIPEIQQNVIVKYINENVRTVYPKPMYKVITPIDYNDKNRLEVEENSMNENDFMIGPILDEDHGNWVLSVYCKDIDGEWIEMFQVITITVIEGIPMKDSMMNLKKGSDFHISFQYPLKDLESCELTAPWRTVDRYFDMNRIELDKCGYVIPNVTKDDGGIWKVIGVGKIVYEGSVLLKVSDEDETAEDYYKKRTIIRNDDNYKNR